MIPFAHTTEDPCPAQESLSLLRQAWEYAAEFRASRWEFAVDVSTLCANGTSISDLRWLVHKGLAEHGRDVSTYDDGRRQFEVGIPILPRKDSCIVLTEAGAEALGVHKPRESDTKTASPVCPHWDDDIGKLWYGGELVKQYRLPSDNQRAVLAAYEEEHWPHRIDDPLAYSADIDPKRRLNATIARLNGYQINQRIRFRGDGSGTGVCWEPR